MKNPYAGFWLRAVAFTIDTIIVSIPVWIMGMIAFFGMAIGLMGELQGASNTETMTPEELAAVLSFFGVILLVQLLFWVIFWLYFSLFESSSKQATWGKQIMGIKVVDANGQRISFGRATGRTLGKFISYMTLYIGFILAGTTARKQALHDFMANTFVVRKEFVPGAELPEGKNHPLWLVGLILLMISLLFLPIIAAILIPVLMSSSQPALVNRAKAQLYQMKNSPSQSREPVIKQEFSYYYNIDGLRAKSNNAANPYILYLPQGSNTVCCEEMPGTTCPTQLVTACRE